MNSTAKRFNRLYDVYVAAKILGVSEKQVIALIKAGKLKAFKINGKWRINERELQQNDI